jgi:hypothetical protein
MNHLYQEDPLNSSEDMLAQLTITISRDEEFGYTCDWDSTDKGTSALASIFYGIAYDDLIEKILNGLREQCVLEGNEEDFLTIVQTIKGFLLSAGNVKDGTSGGISGESIAVSPRDVLKQ